MLVIILLAAKTNPLSHPAPPAEPGQMEICALIRTMPHFEDTDFVLELLDTNRQQIVEQLTKTRHNMERYDAEKVGWQNVIDSDGADDPKPGTWLLGALAIACE